MMVDLMCWLKRVYRRDHPKMARPFKGLEYKDFHTTFTKSDEEPTLFTSVGNEADRVGPT
jgi:hypothetical protein